MIIKGQLELSKRTSLLQLMIQEIGYERSQIQLFEWKERLRPNSFVVTKLVCHIEKFEYFFEFGYYKSKQWRLTYTGDMPFQTNTRITDSWTQVLTYFRQWAQRLLVEVQSLEIWKSLQSPFPIYAPDLSTSSIPFAQEEKPKIKKELDKLHNKIQKLFQMEVDQKTYLRAMFDILRNTLIRFSRSDWIHTFIGIATAIAMELGISFVNDEPLWQIFRETLKHIVEKLTLPI